MIITLIGVNSLLILTGLVTGEDYWTNVRWVLRAIAADIWTFIAHYLPLIIAAGITSVIAIALAAVLFQYISGRERLQPCKLILLTLSAVAALISWLTAPNWPWDRLISLALLVIYLAVVVGQIAMRNRD